MANQHVIDPRQSLFLAYYIDPKSATFSNALQSALKAGYAQEYAESITSQLPDWLSEALGDLTRLKKSEKNLEEVQNFEVVDAEGKIDVNLLDKRIKVDLFLVETLGKQKYSKRSELTGKDGKELVPSSVAEMTNEQLEQLLKTRSVG